MVSSTKIGIYADKWLANHPAVYAVDSEIIDGLSYALKGNTFAVLRGRDVRYCELHETDELISACKVPMIAEELKSVIADIVDHKNSRREIITGKRRKRK